MIARSLAASIAALVLLGGCKPETGFAWGEASPPPHGRYVGVGIYGPQKQWTRMVAAQQHLDDASARPIDDQVILVVTDSATGEIRACGDLTGYCIGLNPWTRPLLASQVAPIKLSSHVPSDEPDVSAALAPKRHYRHRPAASPRGPRASDPG